jgi:hypothetical protein
MRIQFETEGGFAPIPGLSKPVTIDTTQLPAPEAAHIEGLVHNTSFFGLPAKLGAPMRGAADLRTYTITVEEGGQSHTIQVMEPPQDQNLAALVAHLRAVQRGTA